MKSMAEVQADTLHDDVRRIVVAQQFAEDFLLVMMNDFPSYRELMEEGEGETISSLSDKLRGQWEELASQVVELVEENISTTASWVIAQMIQGQGSLPFDLIAREVLNKVEEVSA